MKWIGCIILLFLVGISSASTITLNQSQVVSGECLNISYAGLQDGARSQLIITSRMTGSKEWYFYLEDFENPFTLNPACVVVSVSNLTRIGVKQVTPTSDITLYQILTGKPYTQKFGYMGIVHRTPFIINAEYYKLVGMSGISVQEGQVNAVLNVQGIKYGPTEGTIKVKVNTNLRGRFRMLVKINDDILLSKWIEVL